MKMKKILYYSFILILLSGCNSNTNETGKITEESNNQNSALIKEITSSDSITSCNQYHHDRFNIRDINLIDLNSKAIEFLEYGKIDNDRSVKDSLLCLSIMCFDIMIEIDSNHRNAYINKSIAYSELGNYLKSIETLHALKSIKKDYPESSFRIGIMYEKMGNDSLAMEYYKSAYNEYTEYLPTTNATASDDINFEFLFLLFMGKDKAIERLEKKISESPNNLTYITLKRSFSEFDRKTFIDEF